jgi:hypothetical protein
MLSKSRWDVVSLLGSMSSQLVRQYFQSILLVNARLHLYADLSSRLFLLQYCKNLRYFKVFHHVKVLVFHVPKFT